jgi:hypothetical protein
MHGHIHSVTAQLPNPYASLAMDKAAAAQRAATLRRELLRAANELDPDESPEVRAMYAGWTETDAKKRGRKPIPLKGMNGNEVEELQPISFWA